jgi:hypothetical protein
LERSRVGEVDERALRVLERLEKARLTLCHALLEARL